ncbi:MAG: SulP family inorganic anion transporter [Anaerolineae bacterium]|nr:SulP family inorganic anion transporter [Anaerolineae bacterium]
MTDTTPSRRLSSGFSTKELVSDIGAGITKSIDSVTGGMGNAVLAGLNPVYGLYTVLAATPIGALFTSSVFMNIDSTSAIAATAGSLLLIYPEEQRPAAVAVLTLLTGILMLAAGLLKLGFLTRFISNAVLRGFITGIGVNVILGQLGDFTGYSSEFENKVVKAVDTALHLNQVNPQVLLVGVVTVVLILVLDRIRYINKVSLLIALVAASALVPLLGLTTVPLVSSLGPMADSLPRPVLPDLTLIPGLIGAAFSLTIIALAQSAGISQSYVNPDGKYPEPSRDFTGQGAANLAASLVQGLPAGGSLGGTALLVKGGARSRWANIFTAISAAVLILLFGNLIGNLAISALAGLLIVIGFQIVKADEIRKIWHTSRRARWLMIATFVATLIVPLQWAIFFGVAASFAIFAYNESESSRILEVMVSDDGIPVERPAPVGLSSRSVIHLIVQGNLFFAGARNLEAGLPQAEHAQNAVVILNLRGQSEVGSTLLGVLERYAKSLRAQGNVLMVANVTPTVYGQLEATATLAVLGEDNVFLAGAPGESVRKAYQKAQDTIRA